MSDSSSKEKKVAITPAYTLKSIMRYQKNTVKKIGVDFYYDTDRELISFIENMSNMSDFIRSLILADITENPVAINLDHNAPRRYNKSDCRRFSVLLHKTKDAAIIERLSLYPNKGLYIRNLASMNLASKL